MNYKTHETASMLEYYIWGRWKYMFRGLSHLCMFQNKPCLLFFQQYNQRQKGKLILLALASSETKKEAGEGGQHADNLACSMPVALLKDSTNA